MRLDAVNRTGGTRAVGRGARKHTALLPRAAVRSRHSLVMSMLAVAAPGLWRGQGAWALSASNTGPFSDVAHHESAPPHIFGARRHPASNPREFASLPQRTRPCLRPHKPCAACSRLDCLSGLSTRCPSGLTMKSPNSKSLQAGCSGQRQQASARGCARGVARGARRCRTARAANLALRETGTWLGALLQLASRFPLEPAARSLTCPATLPCTRADQGASGKQCGPAEQPCSSFPPTPPAAAAPQPAVKREAWGCSLSLDPPAPQHAHPSPFLAAQMRRRSDPCGGSEGAAGCVRPAPTPAAAAPMPGSRAASQPQPAASRASQPATAGDALAFVTAFGQLAELQGYAGTATSAALDRPPPAFPPPWSRPVPRTPTRPPAPFPAPSSSPQCRRPLVDTGGPQSLTPPRSACAAPPPPDPATGEWHQGRLRVWSFWFGLASSRTACSRQIPALPAALNRLSAPSSACSQQRQLPLLRLRPGQQRRQQPQLQRPRLRPQARPRRRGGPAGVPAPLRRHLAPHHRHGHDPAVHRGGHPDVLRWQPLHAPARQRQPRCCHHCVGLRAPPAGVSCTGLPLAWPQLWPFPAGLCLTNATKAPAREAGPLLLNSTEKPTHFRFSQIFHAAHSRFSIVLRPALPCRHAPHGALCNHAAHSSSIRMFSTRLFCHECSPALPKGSINAKHIGYPLCCAPL